MSLIETAVVTRKTEIKWIFKNTKLDWPTKKPGEVLVSPPSHAEGDEEVKWDLEVYPSGVTDNSKGHISAFLRLRNCPTSRHPIVASFSLILFDEEEKKVLTQGKFEVKSHTFIPGPSAGTLGWSKMAKQADVLKSSFFSLICEVEYVAAMTSTLVLTRQLMVSTTEEANSSLTQDLEQFFINRSDTDICFVIDGKEIQAHKAILSARSPVIAAMLKSGMREAAENRIEIEDIAPDIFEALLRFIYTDRVDLTKIDTRDLLAAANKYLLPLLKFQCQQYLSERIENENCVELLALADLHNAVHLKKSALNYIRLNRADIMKTDGWKNLKQSRPDLSFIFDVVENLP